MPAPSPGEAACLDQFAGQAVSGVRELPVVGVTPVSVTLDTPSTGEIVVDALESGNDLTLEVGAAGSDSTTHADSPVRRAGRQWAIVPPGAAGQLVVRLSGKEHADVSGRVTLRAYALGPDGVSSRCVKAVRALAAGDASYARGQDINRA